MHPADIQAALIKAGYNQAKIASDLNVSHNAVSLVIHGRTKSARIAKHVSKLTKLPLSILWPGRYVTRDQLRRAA